MSNKVFIFILGVIIAGSVGFIVVKGDNQTSAARPGIEQPDNGQKHVADNPEAYGEGTPPTSGDHSSPLPWQVYQQEVPDINSIHNLEHGGVYISYRPDLPADQVQKITALFGSPFSRDKFTPNKALVAPRSANEAPIIMSSWNRNMKLEAFDEEKMVEYYLQNVGKSPEATAS